MLVTGRLRFGSVRLRFGGGTVRAVPVFGSGGSSAKKVSLSQYSFTGKDGSGSGFGSWKTVPAVPVPLAVLGKTVPTVPVSGSGSVPEPPCCYPKEKHKMGEVHEVFVLALSLVWFAGATPET